jgi:hypothetical protein
MEASSRSTSSDEGEVERGAALSPPSPPHLAPCRHRDAVPLQTGCSASGHRPKHPQAEGRPPSSSSKQLLPMQVASDRVGERDPFVCISEEEMGLTPRPEVQQVLETPIATSSSSFGEPDPLLRKVCTKGCLSLSA